LAGGEWPLEEPVGGRLRRNHSRRRKENLMISAILPIQPSHQTALRPAVAKATTKAATAAAASAPPAAATTTTPGLADESTFLTLLVTQLQYQDPLNPADSTQFVTQLAQFSQLEDLQNINQNVITISNSITAAGG
jgi:hypothetical protein